MGLEAATYVSDLDVNNPVGGDPASTLDNHIRLIKQVLINQFGNLPDAALTVAAAAVLNELGITQASSDNSTKPASTAFVQALLASVNATTGVPVLSLVSAASQTAAAGQHLGLTNAGLTTITLPLTPSAGQLLWVTPMNGRFDNVIARNGQNIMGLAEDMRLDSPFLTYALRFTNSAQGWRLI